jgi:hypothetical protein
LREELWCGRYQETRSSKKEFGTLHESECSSEAVRPG